MGSSPGQQSSQRAGEFCARSEKGYCGDLWVLIAGDHRVGIFSPTPHNTGKGKDKENKVEMHDRYFRVWLLRQVCLGILKYTVCFRSEPPKLRLFAHSPVVFQDDFASSTYPLTLSFRSLETGCPAQCLFYRPMVSEVTTNQLFLQMLSSPAEKRLPEFMVPSTAAH